MREHSIPKESLISTLLDCLYALEDYQIDEYEEMTISSFLYNPDKIISEYLQDLKDYIKIKIPTDRQRKEAGNLLEKIVAVAFCGLKGLTSIKSFHSAGPQYDLLVSGDRKQWFLLYRLFYMKENQRDIVVEAKCTEAKVNDQQFARLCSLMEINLPSTTGLGIFFTLNGASGFPKRGQESRQQKLGDARLRQALFHARTGKTIIVLDAQDIFELDKPASLIQILAGKIRDVEQLSGLAIEPCSDLIAVDLPSHLAPIISHLLGS
jgi:hypothetical protein